MTRDPTGSARGPWPAAARAPVRAARRPPPAQPGTPRTRSGTACARAPLLDDADAAALAAFDAATRAEPGAPEGAFQAELVTRIMAAAWRVLMPE